MRKGNAPPIGGMLEFWNAEIKGLRTTLLKVTESALCFDPDDGISYLLKLTALKARSSTLGTSNFSSLHT